MEQLNGIKIAVDAMGGDFAPGEIVLGALQAESNLNIGIILVGKREEIEKAVARANITEITPEIVEAAEVITDEEQPAIAVMKKRDSSLAVATRMVKEKKRRRWSTPVPTVLLWLPVCNIWGRFARIACRLSAGAFSQPGS